jgi:quercetin dioxygenase-like cupin family protein
MKGNPLSRQRFRLSALAAIGMLIAAGTMAAPAAATPPTGLTAAQIGSGDLPEPVRALLEDARTGHAPEVDVAQVVISEFQLQPGGEFGWHRHGGPVWAVVTAGELHLYSGEDQECQAEVFPAGTGFLDPGDHIHNARNEGEEIVTVHAAFMLPDGADLRIDVEDPGNCNF